MVVAAAQLARPMTTVVPSWNKLASPWGVLVCLVFRIHILNRL